MFSLVLLIDWTYEFLFIMRWYCYCMFMSRPLSLRTTDIIIKHREMRKLQLTFRFIASKGHWLGWVEWVKGSTPVTTVPSSNTTPSALHARWATVKGVATGHAVIMVAVYEIIASSIPTICREKKIGSFSLSSKFYLNFPQSWDKKKRWKKQLSSLITGGKEDASLEEVVETSLGLYTGSYWISVLMFLMISHIPRFHISCDSHTVLCRRTLFNKAHFFAALRLSSELGKIRVEKSNFSTSNLLHHLSRKHGKPNYN